MGVAGGGVGWGRLLARYEKRGGGGMLSVSGPIRRAGGEGGGEYDCNRGARKGVDWGGAGGALAPTNICC